MPYYMAYCFILRIAQAYCVDITQLPISQDLALSVFSLFASISSRLAWWQRWDLQSRRKTRETFYKKVFATRDHVRTDVV